MMWAVSLHLPCVNWTVAHHSRWIQWWMNRWTCIIDGTERLMVLAPLVYWGEESLLLNALSLSQKKRGKVYLLVCKLIKLTVHNVLSNSSFLCFAFVCVCVFLPYVFVYCSQYLSLVSEMSGWSGWWRRSVHRAVARGDIIALQVHTFTSTWLS